MLLWQLTLIVLYIVWSIYSIKIIIDNPKIVYDKYEEGNPVVNMWIFITIVIMIILLVFNVPWWIKIF